MDTGVKDTLIELQKILYKKSDIEYKMDSIPKALETKKELLSRLKKSFVDNNQYIERKNLKIRNLRSKLEDVKLSREENEKKMDVIETQREYEILDKMIKDASVKEQFTRKNLVKEEAALQELLDNMENTQELIVSQEEDIENEKQNIEATILEYENELKDLSKEEKKLSKEFSDEFLYKFDRIVRKKEGVAIVPIKKDVCSGCHMILPLQFVNDIRDNITNSFCPYCSRVLYHEDIAESNEDFKFDISDTGGLSDLNPEIDF